MKILTVAMQQIGKLGLGGKKRSSVSRVLVDFPVNQQLPLDHCTLRGMY